MSLKKKKASEPFDGEKAVMPEDKETKKSGKIAAKLNAISGKAKEFSDFAKSRITGRTITSDRSDEGEKYYTRRRPFRFER